MKKILVPCDFSRPSIEAFKFAVKLAKASGGQVMVLKVMDLPFLYDTTFGGQPYTFDPGMINAIFQDSQKQFDKLVAKHSKDFDNVSFAVEQGPVSTVIRQHMNAKKPDLVVMGTHGATGLKEFLVGSNTEKIVRFSNVPVFAIRKAVSLSSIKNIVFPTTLQLNQGDFIRRLKGLQNIFSAKLHLLHVNTPSQFVIEEELEAYAKHNVLTNYTLNLRSSRHEPDAIIDFARGKKLYMIAMPTHARKGLAHLVSGSITEEVVNHVDCPIWTYALKKGS